MIVGDSNSPWCSSMIIDLHLDSSDPYFDYRYALHDQMKIFENAFDQAIVTNQYDLRVIHGIGSGILKNTIHSYLKKQNTVSEYNNDWHPKYGMGSTLIIFKL